MSSEIKYPSGFHTPSHNIEDLELPPRVSSYALEERLRLASTTEMLRTRDLMLQAADDIKSLLEEVSNLRQMEANECFVIWAALGKALYGHSHNMPSEELIADTIIGIPQEWAMVQEAVKRLTEQPFSLDEYQRRCNDTADYPEANTGNQTAITYTVLGLSGEAGELADKWKKVLRGDHGQDAHLPPEVRALMVKELGDVAWYLARCAKELGVPLSEVAQGNLDKLASRQQRGVIKGSGDLR